MATITLLTKRDDEEQYDVEGMYTDADESLDHARTFMSERGGVWYDTYTGQDIDNYILSDWTVQAGNLELKNEYGDMLKLVVK